MRKITSTTDIRRYAIGDLHGCIEEARRALQWCAEDAAADNVEAEIVLLGDYVDKGTDSRAVLDMLVEGPNDNHVTWIPLRGNHDDLFQRAWFDPSDPLAAAWWEQGGQDTLLSYGWDPLRDALPGRLSEYVPESHASFLRGLPLIYETNDLIFVHAGLNKDRAIDEQTDRDLMWIRGPFLGTDFNFGRPVVHGHSPDSKNPRSDEFRVSMDTGCYGSGRLAIARFEPGERVPTFKIIRRERQDEGYDEICAPKLR